MPTETASNPRRTCPQSKFPVVEHANVQKPQGLHVLERDIEEQQVHTLLSLKMLNRRKLTQNKE